MRVVSGQVEFLSAHLQRLQNDSAMLMILNVDWSSLTSVIENTAKDMHQGVKVLICRGKWARVRSLRRGRRSGVLFTVSYAKCRS